MANQTPSCPSSALDPAGAIASQKLSSCSASVLPTSQAEYLGGFWHFAPFYDRSGRYSCYHMTRTLSGGQTAKSALTCILSIPCLSPKNLWLGGDAIPRTGLGCHG